MSGMNELRKIIGNLMENLTCVSDDEYWSGYRNGYDDALDDLMDELKESDLEIIEKSKINEMAEMYERRR